MPSTFTSFAILGYGNVAQRIVAALVAIPNTSVTILTRSAPSPSPPSRAKIALISDYTNTNNEITRVLNDLAQAEVVIDATKVSEFAFHATLADAAKRAKSVKLFVPSEYGNVSEGLKDNFKADLHPYLRKIGLPYVLIWAAQTSQGKFYILGKGQTPASFTSLDDVAGFIAHILTNYPLNTLHNTSFRLQGDRQTFTEVSRFFSNKYPVVYLDINEDIPGSDESDDIAFANVVQRWFSSGQGSTGWDGERGRDREELAGSGNKFWKGHSWTTIRDIWG